MYIFLYLISYVLCLMSYMSYMSYVYLLMICLSCLMTYILCLILCPMSYDLKALVYVLFLGLRLTISWLVSMHCVLVDMSFLTHAYFIWATWHIWRILIPLEEPPHLTADLSGLTSLGCGQHLTSETCFFNLKHTHFGIHTTQFVYFRNTFKKSGKALFFLTVWIHGW